MTKPSPPSSSASSSAAPDAPPSGDPSVDDAVGQRTDASFGTAAFWSYLMDGSRVITSLVVTLILASLLDASIFGTATWAIVFVLLIRLVLQNGMVAAIIQREELEDRHLVAGFWMVVAVAAVLTVATWFVAPLVADATDDPALTDVLRALAALVPIGALGVLPEAIQRRRMEFRPLAIRTTTGVVLGSVVAVILAYSGAGVWSLVAQQLVTESVALVLLWVITDWRPRRRPQRAAVLDLFPFWASMCAAAMGSFMRWRADTLLIAFFVPNATVGLYRFASRFPETWSEVSVRSLQNVALPELARYQNDRAIFRERVIAVIRLSAMISIPALGVLAGLSEPLIDLVGVDKWGDANIGLKIIAGATAVKALTFFSAPVLQALGRTGLLAALTWFHAAVSVGVFVGVGKAFEDAAANDQVDGIALGRLGVLVFAALVDVAVVSRVVGVSVPAVVGAILPSGIAAGVAFVVTTVIVRLVDALPAILTLGAGGAVGGLAMVAALLTVESQARDFAAKAPVVGKYFAVRS
ncbi:MAG: oligosaccharide flippase family protein [Acidimicrobiales bacterium]|nr:oligosaccharide flippase family protein [Acidimicrobiales bacterium]